MFCASQEVREAILGVAFSPPKKGWRQRHGARFLVPGYGQKNALYYIILYHIILLYIILLYIIYYIIYICNMQKPCSSPGSIHFLGGPYEGYLHQAMRRKKCRPFGLCLCPKWGIPNNCHCNMVERVAPCNWMIFPENCI